jgi:arylsulfatase A-like enzyme
VNVIVIVNDSFRRDHLGCYGNNWIHTPNLDKFAQESIIFDQAYIASYPTVPNRWDMNTGRFGFPFRGWQPLDQEDVTVAEILGKYGFTSMLIHDTPMLEMHEFNYTKGYSAFWWIRGQHSDPFITDPSISLRLPAEAHKIFRPQNLVNYIRNQANRHNEEEYPVARSIKASIEWLETNANLDKFMLWVDMWDPHEPFDPPDNDWNLYKNPEYTGDRIIYPVYGRSNYMTQQELESVQALYAGKVTLVDRWVGKLFATIEKLRLLKDTLIIWTTDHGHLFGEHDLQGKPAGELGRLYEETTRIPLIIRHPDGLGAGSHVNGLVQPPDLLPTIIEFLDLPETENYEGKSLWPLVNDKDVKAIRNIAISSRFPPMEKDNTPLSSGFLFDGWATSSRSVDPITLTTDKWAYICSPIGEQSELYDLENDPGQENNIIDNYSDVSEDFRNQIVKFLEDHGSTRERIEPFIKTVSDYTVSPNTELWSIRDNEGQIISFSSEDEARSRVNWDAPGPKRLIEKTTLRQVFDNNPKNLVHTSSQYYWAQDLLKEN